MYLHSKKARAKRCKTAVYLCGDSTPHRLDTHTPIIFACVDAHFCVHLREQEGTSPKVQDNRINTRGASLPIALTHTPLSSLRLWMYVFVCICTSKRARAKITGYLRMGLNRDSPPVHDVAVCCSVLQCVAVCCSYSHSRRSVLHRDTPSS